ncbi:CubicO group peptidase (beta-lactamase class C family) [Propionicimonas paludicola]|uniref:CubicO group peptidase (Beta-lactamase class C family) n=1 Tax=Propionicimonas paludicola TaxID=185243 RepID=A0A2A9CRH3_9ACTN|nr:serine hydrolase domain-containing protein [Propionicimonas paludicola]PFG16212.1 CubicO group peptidase (beta-lactamase class C family) [Propionicimonas paludicola]
MSRFGRVELVAAVAAAATALAGVLTIPRPPQLSTSVTGDPELAEAVRAQLARLPGARDQLSVAVIDGAEVKKVSFGSSATTAYEIGSITKTVTGALLAQAIERGEVTEATQLGELLDLGDSPAASVPLVELATHSSGLPRLAPSARQWWKAIIASIRATDPYGGSVDELRDEARHAEVGAREFEYSNFGFALLGQALAVAAKTDYPSLVTERVFTPLGMRDSSTPTSPTELKEGALTGYTASGRPASPWTLGASAPAGSIRSTLDDLVRYAVAHRDRTLPFTSAADPRTPIAEGQQIGFAWITTGEVCWHNGGTGGFSSWLGFNRTTGRAVVVLSNTAASVDELGWALMEVK